MQAVTTPIKVMKEKYYKCVKGVFSDSNEQSISNIMSKNSSKWSKYLKVAAFFQIFKWQKKIGFSESSISPPGCLQVPQTQKAVWALESFMAEGNCIVFSFTPRVQGQSGENFEKEKETWSHPCWETRKCWPLSCHLPL